MIQLEIEGQMIELAERDYFEHLIGLAYSTYSVSNLIGNPVFIEDFEKSIATRHVTELENSVKPLEDRELLDLFFDLSGKFIEVQSMNNRIMDVLASKVDLPNPESAEAYAVLVQKLGTSLGENWLPSMFSDPELKPLLDSAFEKLGEMSSVKIRIVKRIVFLYPELAGSEYIDSRDNLQLGLT